MFWSQMQKYASIYKKCISKKKKKKKKCVVGHSRFDVTVGYSKLTSCRIQKLLLCVTQMAVKWMAASSLFAPVVKVTE